jgi:pyruvate/oxaloacetate carboxyltransferase
MGKKKLLFIDESLRDGPQSLWSMFSTYGVHEAICAEMDKAGYHYTTFRSVPSVLR